MKQKPKSETPDAFARLVNKALRRAARRARATARLHGTAVYVWRNGKVVAEKP